MTRKLYAPSLESILRAIAQPLFSRGEPEL
jgi:hypothetical protein